MQIEKLVHSLSAAFETRLSESGVVLNLLSTLFNDVSKDTGTTRYYAIVGPLLRFPCG